MNMTTIQLTAIVVVFVYIAIILLAAHFLAKKSRVMGVGGNRLPWYIIAATSMATMMNAAQLLGTAGTGYNLGLSQMFWMNLCSPLCALILVPYIAERLRNVKCETLSDVVDKRFPKSKSTGVILKIWFVIWGVFACAVSVFGGAVILQTILGLNFWMAAIVTLVVAFIYSVLGGLEAMSVVDTVQYIVIGVLVAILTPVLFIKYGTFSSFFGELLGNTGYNLSAAAEELGFTPGFADIFHLPGWGIGAFFAYICACSFWMFCDMGVIQRVLAERKSGEGVKGIRAYAFIYVPTLSLILTYGLWGRAFFPSVEYADSIVLRVGEVALGGAGTVLFMVATTAAILSTVGAYLNALGLNITGYYKKMKPDAGQTALKSVEYGAIIVAGAIILFGAKLISTDGIILTCVAVQMCMVATVSPMILLMCAWKRFNGKAAFWGLLIGMVVCVASTAHAGGANAAIMGGGFFGIPTLFLGWMVSIPIYVVGSLITKYDPESMSPEFRGVFESKQTYVGKKDLITAVSMVCIIAVVLIVGLNGKLGVFPTFNSAFGAIDVFLIIFVIVSLVGCLFLSYKLIRFIFIDKEFFAKSEEASN